MTEPLRINHRFEVSAERVFEAFVDVNKASKFLFATPTGRMVRAELEPRVCGALLFVERRGERRRARRDGRRARAPDALCLRFQRAERVPSKHSRHG